MKMSNDLNLYDGAWDGEREREKDGVVYVILCDWDSKDRVKW